MGKRKAHIEGRSKEERVAQRKQLGSLRSLTVQPATKKRYDMALNRFFSFLDYEHLTLPKQKVQMDSLLAEYIEHLWSSGCRTPSERPLAHSLAPFKGLESQ